MSGPVRSGQAMVAGMDPVLDDIDYLFCSGLSDEQVAKARDAALGWFAEDEGVSFILQAGRAGTLGFATEPLMRRIVLTVHSALDGVGLTAAVASALADAGIACNMVAAYHHDHVFVPAVDADRALAILQQLQTKAAN
ncbi:ACT domain-containing protein [Novosphingobium sp. G106]|uniref:ACT domain-containing protein n=1 Tax=Novosphingobium sp. G106 TaxID=2849500 RepID=UPI001C2DC396|nr:ACT domain-containing protein [Novosphingobium sp. G106]MBV1691521.1 ACT domain-containing protein [Novosphingobium sp. G106]